MPNNNMVTRTNPPSASQRTNVFAATVMLKHAVPKLILEKSAANVQAFPKNKGDTIKWRRLLALSAATIPLVEGITPNGTKIEFEDVTATVRQYGDYTKFSDQVADLHEDPIGQQISIAHGENIGRTLEALDWGTVQGGTGVLYANGGARNAVNTPISLGLLRSAIRTLKAQKAEMFTSVISGSPNFATQPVGSAYIAMGHTNLENDVRNLPGFVPVENYGGKALIHPDELGKVENVRFVLSPDLAPFADAGGAYAGSGTAMVSTSGTSADVYSLMIFGKDAWARVALRSSSKGDMPVSVQTQMPGKISDSDPLGQRGIVSWKTYYCSTILNNAWMRRIEVAATALS